MLRLRELDVLSGIAILCIVYFHTSPYAPLMQTGLFLFTYIAGYKFIYNHRDKLKDREFLKQYMIKRIFRLYKPYIGYTALIIIPLYIVDQIALGRGLKNPGFQLFSRDTWQLFTDFLIGENPFSYHLWYLVTLLVITLICISLIYIDIRSIYFLLPLVLLNNRLALYLSIFVFGALLAYYRIYIKFPSPFILVYLGKKSFYIYLFHLPFILPGIKMILGDRYLFMPIIISILSVVLSIVAYDITKMIGINKIFE